MIGTDGAVELMGLADAPLPGKETRVGPISQFWRDDRFFANRDAVRRRLSLINSESVRVCPRTGRLERAHGLLPDDTSLAVVRRRPGPLCGEQRP